MPHGTEQEKANHRAIISHRCKLSARLQRRHVTDTYVKAYLFDGERKIEKRKTAVVDQCCNPVFRQAAKYLASDARDVKTTS